MRSRGLLIPLIALVAAVALALAGCGSSPTTQTPKAGGNANAGPFAKYAGLTGPDRTQKLLADAKTEGQVSIYTSNTDIDDLVNGFKQAYPGIKVNAFRANSETVLQRAQQESQARRLNADVIDTDDFELDALNSQGLLADYQSPIREKLRKQALFPGWIATRFNAFVVGWNTKLVPAGQEPKSFEELASPKWKGKLAMELSDFDWYMSLHTYLTTKKGMSDAQADDLFKRLAGNAKVVKGHTVMGELLSAGQYSVALSIYSHTIDKAAHEDGAPVDFRPIVAPVILRPNGAGLVREAKHPAAALLWMDWVLTDGQKEIAKAFRIPAEENVPGFTNPIPAGTETFDVPQDLLVKESKRWSDAYDELVRNAPKAQA
jgi:iron(III) transport system substrate-binding protein